MSKFTDMIKNDINSVFLNENDFGELVVYTSENYSIQCSAIIKHNVELVGEYGQTIEKVTTIDLSSDIDIQIGGTFTRLNSEVYEMDARISDNGFMQVVSVVKQ